MKNFLVLFLLSINCLFSNAAEKSEAQFVVKGNITRDTVAELKSRMNSAQPPTEVEFRDSRGAQGSATIIVNEMGDIIESRKLKTFARGRCASSCAELFLLGVHPTLLRSETDMPTHLMIHPARHSGTGEIGYSDSEKTFRKISAASGGKIPFSLLEKVFDTVNSNGGIFIFRDPFATSSGTQQVLFCVGDEKFLPRTCKPIEKYTPEKLGISISE